MENLGWIEEWYASHCDGEWEHQFGVQLETIDNPGWSLRIELRGTSHQGLTQSWQQLNRTEVNWIHWCVSGDRFIGYCGARNLTELIQIAHDYLRAVPAIPRESVEFRGSVREGRPWSSIAHDTREAGAFTYTPER